VCKTTHASPCPVVPGSERRGGLLPVLYSQRLHGGGWLRRSLLWRRGIGHEPSVKTLWQVRCLTAGSNHVRAETAHAFCPRTALGRRASRVPRTRGRQAATGHGALVCGTARGSVALFANRRLMRQVAWG